MIVMSFDLSTMCIGVICANINDRTGKIKTVLSCPIIPVNFDAKTLGFLSSKKKLPTAKGTLINTYVYPGETQITETEKKKRDIKVRSQKDIHILRGISKQMDSLISQIKPDLILVEKNCIFNGILTSILLAKVMGTLLALAGRIDIPVEEYPVTAVRKHHNASQLTKDFAASKTAEELRAIPDITKRALGEIMTKKYSVKFQTDDESDACVVFDYWYTFKYKR